MARAACVALLALALALALAPSVAAVKLADPCRRMGVVTIVGVDAAVPQVRRASN
jgi:hypothetical protein